MVTLHSVKALRSLPTLKLGLVTLGLFLIASPALAHHPSGSQTPTNALQGFLSGLGHPIVGPDHLAFVIAAGLLAAAMGGGLSIPLGFVAASLAGTGLHLMALDLPAPESIISASVLVFGGLLAMKQYPKLGLVIALAALAGLFHGYAYGEAVVGAEMTPLIAYLLGFAGVQMAIATAAYAAAAAFKRHSARPAIAFRVAGFILAGAGATFLSGVLFS